MKKAEKLFVKYATPRNRRALFVIVTLIGMAIAGGAPGASSGIGGGLFGNFFSLGQ